jgi:MATE family multidrug resistance protein
VTTSRSLPRELLHLAWPVLIGQAAVMANGVIDTLMAGRLSPVDLAAVGIGASIYISVIMALMGVLLALTPVVAHHYGAQRHAEIGADVRQCAWLALALSLLAFAALKHPDPLLAFSRLTPEVEIKVRAYLDGTAWAVPGVMFFRVFYGFTTGIGRPRPVMAFNLRRPCAESAAQLGIHVRPFRPARHGRCRLRLVVRHHHVDGRDAGLAVVPARCRLRALWRLRPLRSATPLGTARIPALGLPMGATFLVDVTAFTFMALFIARLGPEVSAAHQIAANVAVFVFMVPLALGSATGVVVGQALGAGESRRARHAGLARAWRSAAARRRSPAPRSASAPARWRAPTQRIRRLSPPRRALLSIVAVYHMADAVQAVMAQVLRGYKRATVPMVIYALSLWGVGLGGGYLLGLTDAFGPARGAAGFWIAAVASLVVAGAGVLAYFLRISAQTIPAPAITSA